MRLVTTARMSVSKGPDPADAPDKRGRVGKGVLLGCGLDAVRDDADVLVRVAGPAGDAAAAGPPDGRGERACTETGQDAPREAPGGRLRRSGRTIASACLQ